MEKQNPPHNSIHPLPFGSLFKQQSHNTMPSAVCIRSVERTKELNLLGVLIKTGAKTDPFRTQ